MSLVSFLDFLVWLFTIASSYMLLASFYWSLGTFLGLVLQSHASLVLWPFFHGHAEFYSQSGYFYGARPMGKNLIPHLMFVLYYVVVLRRTFVSFPDCILLSSRIGFTPDVCSASTSAVCSIPEVRSISWPCYFVRALFYGGCCKSGACSISRLCSSALFCWV